MSKPKRKPGFESALDKGSAARTETAPADPVMRIVQVLAVALVLVRWVIPAESAVAGDTLWVVQLWLAVLLFWVWGSCRSREFVFRVSAFDAALWTLIGGHVVSALLVFHWHGDRRAAVNMAWEWFGLGAEFFLLRQIIRTPIDAKRLATLVVTLGVVLAGLGIWQHYVFYRWAYTEYREMLGELEELKKDPASNANRISKIEFKLQAQGIPSDKAGRRQYENRLRFSNEAFGPFALPATFAGFLLLAIVLAGDLFRGAERPLSKASAAAWIAVFLLLVYCLILTKARSAWIGLVVASAAWGAGAFLTAKRRTVPARKAIAAAGIALAAAAALFALAAVTRGFDFEVVSETRKSLGYRLQYWTGAMGVVRDHVWAGVGPGNFRRHYLRYKVPESSEEIADPHNLVLDLWTSGGITALAGFFGCLVFAVWPFLRRRFEKPADKAPPSADSRLPLVVIPGAAIGFLAAIFAPVVSASGNFDPTQLILLAGWLMTFAILDRGLGTAPLSAAACGGAALGVLVHLLGAGGIEMPAVLQMLLVLAILAFATAGCPVFRVASPRSVIGIGGIAVVLFVCCLVTATLPVLKRRALVSSGEQAIMDYGNFEGAMRDFVDAAVCDPFSPEPHEKLAESFISRWQAGVKPRDTDFADGEKSLKLAIELDPDNPALYRRLGEIYSLKFARTRDRADALAAAAALGQAVDRYQNESSLRAALASALSDAGLSAEAKEQAERALALDQLNHDRGHSDRFLDAAALARLDRIAGRPAK